MFSANKEVLDLILESLESRAERSRERSRYSLRTEGSLVCIVHDHVVCTVQCVPGLLCTVVVRDVCSCSAAPGPGQIGNRVSRGE
jgi:hypothetical protein